MSQDRIERLLGKDVSGALGRLLATGPGAAMVAEIEAERIDERSRLVGDLERITGADADAVHQSNAAFRDAEAASRAAQEAVAAAQATAERAREAWERQIRSSSRARARIMARLEATADPQIFDFLAWIERERQACAWPRTPISNSSTNKAIDGDDKDIRAALSARRRALGEAHEAACRLKLEAIGSSEVERRIESIRATLPADPGGQVGAFMGRSW